MSEQTHIAAPSGPAFQTPRAQPEWLAGLNVPTDIEPSFFRAESKKQTVVVQNVVGFGDGGKVVQLRMKDAAGNPVTKDAKCFAEVDLLDPETMRNYRWQILSRATAAQLVHAIAKHGPTWRGELEIQVWAEGRGLQRTTNVVAVRPELTPADNEEGFSTGANSEVRDGEPAGTETAETPAQ